MAEHWEREALAQLRLRLKAKERQVEAYRSGAKYQSMKDALLRLEKSDARKMKKLNKELGDAHAETVTVREQWFQIFDDCEREWVRKRKQYERKLARKDAEMEKLEKKLGAGHSEETPRPDKPRFRDVQSAFLVRHEPQENPEQPGKDGPEAWRSARAHRPSPPETEADECRPVASAEGSSGESGALPERQGDSKTGGQSADSAGRHRVPRRSLP